MNPPLSIEQLKQLKGIMQTMLLEANNANWQELSRLDSERRVLIGYKERTVISQQKLVGKTPSGSQLPSGMKSESGSGARQEPQAAHLSETPALASANPTRQAPNSVYAALSKELTALDKEITKTVLDARQALLEETRVLRAQVSAKKGYEQASTMKISSYS